MSPDYEPLSENGGVEPQITQMNAVPALGGGVIVKDSITFPKIILIGFLTGFILTGIGRFLIYLNGPLCEIGISGELGMVMSCLGYIPLAIIHPVVIQEGLNGFTIFSITLLLIIQGIICTIIGFIVFLAVRIIKNKISALAKTSGTHLTG